MFVWVNVVVVLLVSAQFCFGFLDGISVDSAGCIDKTIVSGARMDASCSNQCSDKDLVANYLKRLIM